MPQRTPSLTRPVAALLDVAFDEAIDFARQREVMLPARYYDELQGAARAQAFTVSHLTSLRQIGQVLDALVAALVGGQTFRQFTAAVEADEIDLAPAHRETVFRTAVQTSYGAGRRTQQQGNAENRSLIMYDAINDSRTRPAHRAMDGFIAPVGDPVWKSWTPPCGFSCRCSTIALTEPMARARGYTGTVRQPEVQPDDGWNYDPADRGAHQQRLDMAVADARRGLPPAVQRASGARLIAAARDKPAG